MSDFNFFRDGGERLLNSITHDAFREGVEQRRADDAAKRKLEQEKYNQDRQRQYHSDLAAALKNGEHDRAAYLAYQYGDDKVGSGIRETRKEAFERGKSGNTTYANIAGGLARIPYEQRRSAIAASKQRLMALGIPEAEIDAFDPTDANLTALASLDYSTKDREAHAISQQNADTQRMDADTNRFKAESELSKPVVVDGALVDPKTGTPIYRAPKVEHTPYGSNQYVTPGVENGGSPSAAAPQQSAPTGNYAPPVGQITSGYGPRRAPIAGASTNHRGVDVALPRGAPAPVVADGTVVSAAPNGGYGNQVRVRHDDGTETTYSHLGSISVRPGDRITKGQPVGLVGSTGTATGPHLHYEVHQGGQPVNPQQFAAQRQQPRQTTPTMTPGHPKPESTNGGRSSGKKVHKGWLDNFSDTANMYRSFDNSIRTFRKGYGGNLAGEVENLLQGVAGDRVGTPGQRDWWAAHRANDNVERHKIFGAALTATEKAAWTSTTISPSMSDEQIVTNLKRRREILAGVLRRQRRFLIAEGANPESLAALAEGI